MKGSKGFYTGSGILRALLAASLLPLLHGAAAGRFSFVRAPDQTLTFSVEQFRPDVNVPGIASIYKPEIYLRTTRSQWQMLLSGRKKVLAVERMRFLVQMRRMRTQAGIFGSPLSLPLDPEEIKLRILDIARFQNIRAPE